MQKVENFMRELFLDRIAEEKRILENRAAYRQKYFIINCRWDNRAGTLEMIQTEVIASVQISDSEAKVVTEYKVPYYASGPRIHRRRYYLQAEAGSWLICNVEHQCTLCHGQGDEECRSCKGKHWK